METSNNEATESYKSRTAQRQLQLMSATMSFVGYFMGLGDDQTTAESKVSGVSTFVAPLLYVYTLGNKQPLTDAINNINIVDLPFMDEAAKSFLITKLSVK